MPRAARQDDDQGVTTGRKLIENALRAPLRERGWAPRAAGWFTRPVTPGTLGVVAVGVASKRAEPGQAGATIYVHLRDEQLEAEVASVTGTTAGGYRTTTSTTSIGYLMPAARWSEWQVEPDSADAVADEIADAVQTYAEPHLRRLAADPQALLAAITSSPSYSGSSGLARAVLLLRRMGEEAEATQLLGDRVTGLADRTDAAATEERRVGAILGRLLAQ